MGDQAAGAACDLDTGAGGDDLSESHTHILIAAGLSSPRDHALVSLLALNGLRVSEAIGADIDALGLERGHRTLTVVRKGGKPATMPLAPRVARAVDLAIGDRLDGPIFIEPERHRLDRHAAGRIVRRSSVALRSPSGSDHTRFVTRSSPPRWMPASRCEMSKKQPATPTHAPRCATTVAASPSTGTPPTSSPRSSPAPHAEPSARWCAATAHRTTPLATPPRRSAPNGCSRSGRGGGSRAGIRSLEHPTCRVSAVHVDASV